MITGYVEYTNSWGRVVGYQPKIHRDGKGPLTLWKALGYRVWATHYVGVTEPGYEPVLCRTRWGAQRKAKRHVRSVI